MQMRLTCTLVQIIRDGQKVPNLSLRVKWAKNIKKNFILQLRNTLLTGYRGMKFVFLRGSIIFETITN